MFSNLFKLKITKIFMNINYIVGGIILWVIAYCSIMTSWGFDIFFQVFGILSMVVTYGIVILGFWVVIIGLIKDKPYRRHWNRRRHWN